ncbi:hypothetical protein [Paenibacillus caui]|uniref:hypothetical protein n=1 Tax=Paenibacillus caui TaxID=2873927 RepID=UPI001CA96B52|nr:hypothetical protein [Paenibacillus caui]
MKSKERNRILLNGMFISIGLLAVLDNVFSHWLFKWHRILPNETLSEYLEAALFILGLVLLGTGLLREIRNRRTKDS